MKKLNSKIIWIIAYVILLAPFVYSIALSMPAADDFSQCVKEGNLLLGALKATGDRYMHLGGRWTTWFYVYFLNPVRIFGPSSRLCSLILLLDFAFFIYAAYKFLGCILSLIFGLDKKDVDLLRFIALAGFLFAIHYREVFYWFCGSPYQLLEACLLMTGSYIVIFFIKGEKKAYIPMIIWGILATTGELWCIPVGLFYLCVCIAYRKNESSIVKKVLPLILYIISGLVMVLAPGNFEKSEQFTGSANWGERIFKAAVWSLQIMGHQGLKLLAKPIFWIGLLAAVLVGIFVVERKEREHLLIKVVIYFITLLGVIYPFVLGYGGAGYLSNRVEFSFDNIFIFFAYILAAIIANAVAYKVKFTENKKIFASACILLAVLTVGVFAKMGAATTTWSNIVVNAGVIKQESDYGYGLIKEIESSTSDEVVIDEIFYTYTGILDNFLIADDETHWVNMGVADFFDKKSVKANYLDTGSYEPYE